jgi:alkanesulfonate monooxygenase SsuD/methylene tetrahydromethanopterin reductase-like flavin-dependent oxidoreductase (luciferase family)
MYDGWLPYPPHPEDYASGLASVRQAATDAGRLPQAIAPALFVTVLIADDVEQGRRALAEYSQINYGVPLEILETIQVLITGSRAHVATELGRYTAAGARHIVVRIGAPGLEAQLDQAEQIIEIPLRLAPPSMTGPRDGSRHGRHPAHAHSHELSRRIRS